MKHQAARTPVPRSSVSSSEVVNVVPAETSQAHPALAHMVRFVIALQLPDDGADDAGGIVATMVVGGITIGIGMEVEGAAVGSSPPLPLQESPSQLQSVPGKALPTRSQAILPAVARWLAGIMPIDRWARAQ